MDSPNGFAPLADRPPFDVAPEELEQEGSEDISPAVAEVLRICAEAGFDYADFLELALCSIDEMDAELTAGLGPEVIAANPTTVATLERLSIAASILAGVSLGDDDDGPEEDGEEGTAEEEEEGAEMG